MSNKTGSEIGNWLFLIGLFLLPGALLAYDQWPIVQSFLEAWQAPQTGPVVAESVGPGNWIVQNWGAILLVAALVAAGVKRYLDRPGVGADGNSITYKRYKILNVKLVR